MPSPIRASATTALDELDRGPGVSGSEPLSRRPTGATPAVTAGRPVAPTPIASASQVVIDHVSPTRAAVRRFMRHRLAIVGLVLVGTVVLLAVIAPLLTPWGPNFIDFQIGSRQPPSARHVLGTDVSGRDVWARVLYGGRTSVTVGFGAVSLYLAIGTMLGLVAGFYGRFLDQAIMRLTDTIMSVPPLLLIIVFVSVVGPSIGSVIAVIGLLGWPQTTRLVRGQLLVLREAEFINAARVVGVRDRSILLRHMLPNILGPLTVVATFGVATAVLLESSLSFLGLGVRPPEASWGNLITEATSPVVLNMMPWQWMPAAAAITTMVLGVNFIGDGLRDAIDPKTVRRG
jgi:peptide/nickel transport system permease protein